MRYLAASLAVNFRIKDPIQNYKKYEPVNICINMYKYEFSHS